MPGYENAPATKLLATHCAVCARPLLDAKSVELGIGPDCRRKYGYDLAVSEEARKEANGLVYLIAAKQSGMETVQAIARLGELGFTKLADRILTRMDAIRIVRVGSKVRVFTPYRAAASAGWHRIPGCRGAKEGKTFFREMPDDKATVDAMNAHIRVHFAGLPAITAKGVFIIGNAKAGPVAPAPVSAPAVNPGTPSEHAKVSQDAKQADAARESLKALAAEVAAGRISNRAARKAYDVIIKHHPALPKAEAAQALSDLVETAMNRDVQEAEAAQARAAFESDPDLRQGPPAPAAPKTLDAARARFFRQSPASA